MGRQQKVSSITNQQPSQTSSPKEDNLLHIFFVSIACG
jgi:hypothetical protein